MAEINSSISSPNNFKIRLSLKTLSEIDYPKIDQILKKTKPYQKPKPVSVHIQKVPGGYKVTDEPIRPPKNQMQHTTYPCNYPNCEKEFTDLSSLRKHQNKHSQTSGTKKSSHFKKLTNSFTCPVEECGRKFLDNSKLRRHMLVHTGEKPYRCDFCHKRFSLDFNLKTHLRIHTGEKPYQCTFPGCMKRFTQSSNLSAHERTHYIREGDMKPRAPRSENQATPPPLTQPEQPFSLEETPAYEFDFDLVSATPALPSNNNI